MLRGEFEDMSAPFQEDNRSRKQEEPQAQVASASHNAITTRELHRALYGIHIPYYCCTW